MQSIYTSSVQNVPENYNDPTPAYKKHVWIAVSGILAFFIFYLFLSYRFLNSAYRLLFDAFQGGNSSLTSVGIGIGSLFLGLFMVKAFFFVQTKYDVQDRQITPQQEPVLFDYLHKLADEIGAPRPNKVYLSNRVNASVFYDLSFLNLFFPSKKNLEIGLGLINVLNLGEFKAVLAHEFGHFAQKSMLVGRWVYIANQIANTIITKRDALDSFLSGLNRIDFRIAWIGWILSIIVWSIRSLVELIFRVVVLSQRALSREMEFQADLVAVSVTGSDALIHALHKLQAADAALSEALGTLDQQFGKGKAIEDLYAIQTNAIEKTAYVLNDKEYGKSPRLPAEQPENFRVFSDKIAQPPKMWQTHPPDQEREANAKLRYISGEIDDRSAWDLFSNPALLRTEMTKALIATVKAETELLPTSEAISFHNKQYDKSFLNPDYRGLYLNRYFCQAYEASEDIYLKEMTVREAEQLRSGLYPISLVKEIEDFTTLQEELFQLEAIKEKRLTASGNGEIWHRGTQIRRKELPTVIAGLKEEVKSAKTKVTRHDRAIRTVHLRLAEQIGLGWDVYLKGLIELIHYCEHNIANIQDAEGSLAHVLSIVMADNKVTTSEMNKLLNQTNVVYEAVREVVSHQENIVYDKQILKELELEKGQHLFEPFDFPYASESNINDWLNNISSWTGSYIHSLSRLRTEALELLLKSEEQVMEMSQTQERKAAVAPSKVNASYPLMTPGKEREIKLKLNLWDKFISADGIVPAITKFAVAASIVGGTIFYTGQTGVSDLSIYNGLGQPVIVEVDGSEIRVEPHTHNITTLYGSRGMEINTRTLTGENIETFKPELSRSSSHYVYNVAKASALYEYRVYYGGTPGDYNIMHGNKRWIRSRADYLFSEPPESMTTSGDRTTRDALTGFSNISPINIFNLLPENADIPGLVRAHVLWDPAESSNLMQWVGISTNLEDNKSLLNERLAAHPDEIITLRVLMDQTDEATENEICEKYSVKTAAEPDNANAYYIAARCVTDPALSKQRYLAGVKKWPEHGWMNYAASHFLIKEENWQEAYNKLQTAYKNNVGLQSAIALNTARILRYLEGQGKTVQNAKRLASNYLDYYESIETDRQDGHYEKIHYLIHQGKLKEAVDLINTYPDINENDMIAICGASDGASNTMIEKALLLEPDSLQDEVAVFAAAGLRLRKKRDISPFEERLQSIASAEDYPVMDFIKYIQAKNFSAAKTALRNAGFVSEAQLYSMAYTAYGDQIPADWKRKIKTLLFATEKPFVK